jgi:hypothetical protein
VRSGAGSDIICGSRHADVIEAGAGDDVVVAGRGHDRIHGGAGRDVLFGEGGNDHLKGGTGADTLVGGAGRNRVVRDGMARPRENGAAGGGDVVLPGVQAISIIMDPADVDDLMFEDAMFAFDWVPVQGAAGGPGGLTPIWQTAAPAPRTVITLAPRVSAFLSVTTLMPYMLLGQNDLVFQILNESLDRDRTAWSHDWDIMHAWTVDAGSIRKDPRFARIVERIGLVDYWKQYGYPDHCRAGSGAVALVCSS